MKIEYTYAFSAKDVVSDNVRFVPIFADIQRGSLERRRQIKNMDF